MQYNSHSIRLRNTILSIAISALGMSYASAATLLEVYDQAAQSDPTIRGAAATRLASREARPQAWAGFMPDISANWSWAGTTSGGESGSSGTAGSPTVAGTTRGGSWGITATESINLPSMLRSLKRTDYTLALADVTYHAAEQTLATRVATRYFAVLSARDSLNALQVSLDSYNQQLERAEKRFEVGLSAITDVQEARASRDRAASQVISGKQTLATAQEQLRAIAGSQVDNLAAPGDDMPLITPDPQSAEDWVNKGLAGNLDLASARISAEMASYDVGTQKLNRWPTVTLGANYRNSNAYNDFKMLGDDNTTNTWSGTWFSAGVTVPIFSGGLVSSQIRQAVYQQRAARDRVEQVNLDTASSVRDAYLSVQSAISLVQANKQALESSRLALQATEAGFDVGTRTNIDVLTSRQTLLAAEQAYASSRYTYITNIISLKALTGSLTREDLVQINSWLTQ
jgi:outer membrane protein